jgi:hypothetical protein
LDPDPDPYWPPPSSSGSGSGSVKNEYGSTTLLAALILILTVLFSVCLNQKFIGNLHCTKNKTLYIVVINNFIFQLAGDMESGSVSCLTSEEATRLGDEAAAAAATSNSGPVSGNGSLPASSGFVHTANLPIPHSERSTLIRINRDLNNKPAVWGGGPFFLRRHGNLPLSWGWEGKKICIG